MASLSWEVNCDGVVTSAGRVDEAQIGHIPPQGDRTFSLPVPVPDKGKCFLKLYYHRKAPSELVPEGYLLGFDEWPLVNDDGRNQHAAALLAGPAVGGGPLKAADGGDFLIISNERISYVYSKRTGLFSRMSCGGQSFLTRPMEVNVWRAPTDNDRKVKLDWMAAHYDKSVVRAYHTDWRAADGAVKLSSVLSVSAVAVQRFLDIRAEWTVYPDGTVDLSMEAERDPEFPELPRFGLRLFLPGELDQVRYYGYGPHESYVDKHRASSHGVYAAPVSRLHEDYIRPQENGSHFDCDYVEVKGSGAGLTAVSAAPFCFSASPYTQEELAEKAHNYELVPCGETVLCLDYAQNGIGSESCGPRLLPRYRLDGERFQFQIRLIPAVDGN